MLTMVEPRLNQEIEKESLLVSLLLPPPEGASLKSCPTPARAIRRPETAHLFLLSSFSGGRRGRGRQGRQPLCPARRSAGWGGLERSGTAGRGGRLSAPAASPFRFVFPARPPFGKACSCAPTVRAACLLNTGGALERPPGRLRPSPPPSPQPFFLRELPRVKPDCVLANRALGISSGVPPWLSVGFSPCFTQPLPSVTCRRSSPAVPGARVLFVSSKAVSIYRCHCNLAAGKVSITAMRLTRQRARASAQWHVCCGDPHGKSSGLESLGISAGAEIWACCPDETCKFT